MVSFEKSKIQKELIKYRGQTQGQEDNLIKEANRILSADLFSEKKNIRTFNSIQFYFPISK